MRANRHLTISTAIASGLLLTATGVGLAPSASAYYGDEKRVRDAVVTPVNAAKASQWNQVANPLVGTVVREGPYAYGIELTPTIPNGSTVRPTYGGLRVHSSAATRDAAYADAATELKVGATNVEDDHGYLSVEHLVPAADAVPEHHVSTTLHRVGNDGIAIGECVNGTGVDQRTLCSRQVSNHSGWPMVSPVAVWIPTPTMSERLVPKARAQSLSRTPSGVRLHVVRSRADNHSFQEGREVYRVFGRTVTKAAAKKKWASASEVSAIQYGNRTNARVAFDDLRASYRQEVGTLHGQSSTQFTASYAISRKGKRIPQAVTVMIYRGVVTTAVCTGNTAKVPTHKTTRACSNRVAASQLSRMRYLFSPKVGGAGVEVP